LANQKFEADRDIREVQADVKVVKQGNIGMLSTILQKDKNSILNPKYLPLRIPRRPEWRTEMTAKEINSNEQQAFLEWRRDIAQIEEDNVKLAITPFEKNLEVWKQLWRVIERSDLLLQIVDARNPFFFYSRDLERYIEE